VKRPSRRLAHSETVRFAPSQSVALRQPPSILSGSRSTSRLTMVRRPRESWKFECAAVFESAILKWPFEAETSQNAALRDGFYLV
jgi:hypothetical protein